MSPAEKPFNLNSYLISFGVFLIMAMLTWLGNKTTQNNEEIVRLLIVVPAIEKGVTRLENSLNNMVTRVELTNEIRSVKSEIDHNLSETRSDLIRWRSHLQEQNRGLKVPQSDR